MRIELNVYESCVELAPAHFAQDVLTRMLKHEASDRSKTIEILELLKEKVGIYER